MINPELGARLLMSQRFVFSVSSGRAGDLELKFYVV